MKGMTNDVVVSGASIAKFDAPTLPCIDARDGTSSTRPLSELGNARRLNDKHQGNIHYVYDAKVWLHWLDGAWCWDLDGAKVRSLAAILSAQIYNEGCLHLVNAGLYASWSRTSQKERTIKASVSLLSDDETIRLPMSIIDADLFLVGFDQARQVIDLRSGIARPAAQNDYITKSLVVDQLGDSSKAVRWLEFLDQVFGDDIDLIGWVKRWCGYLLTGYTREHVLVFCFGLGANGKSVFAETLRFIIADYARTMSSDTLAESKRSAGSATPDIADLIGARLAMCSETESGVALAESLVKLLVSDDSMTARKLYCAPIQFTKQFKLMMLGNHKPIIKGNDKGIWRRIILIPFARTFKSEQQDPTLLNKLKAEAPHILAWMVEGCLEWQKIGLKDIPVTIKQATDEYQEDQNLLGHWFSECCKLSPSNEESSTELYANYKAWCLVNNLQAVSNVAFGRRLPDHELTKRKSNGNTVWQGVELKIVELAMKA